MDRRLVIVAALALVGGCDKKTGAPTAQPDLVAKPAAIDVAKLSAPALFANVPLDTPYMIAAFEAIPLEYYAKMKRALGPAFGNVFAQLRAASDDDGAERVMTAIEQELDGKWDVKGLESLGFTASPRFAFYGLGVLPMVFRIEVRDDKAVLSTIERVAQRAQLTLPAVQTHDGRSFWRLQMGDMVAIVALADNQLVLAAGRAADVDRHIGLIVGSEKPQASMAAGKVLSEIMVKHGFGPNMIGFVDTRKMLAQGMAFAGLQPSPACTTEIERLGTRVPRAVLGYSLLTSSVSSGGAVLELAPDLVTQVEGMRSEVPGLTEAMAGKPMLAMGGGIQLEKARLLAIEAMTALSRLGAACELEMLVEQAADATRTLSQRLPVPIASMTGVVMALHELSFGTALPMPEKVEGYVAVTSTDAKALFGQLQAQQSEIAKLGIKTDGRFHPVSGIPVPFPIHGGVGDRAVVVAIGTSGKSLGEPIIAARATGKAPFLLMSYDYGKFLEVQSQMSLLVGGASPQQEAERKLNEGLGKLFGRAAASLDAGRHGVTFWATIEMK